MNKSRSEYMNKEIIGIENREVDRKNSVNESISNREEFNEFLESLKYSREKCMLFHGLNIFSILIALFIYFFVWDTFQNEGAFRLYVSLMPVLLIIFSFYTVSRHDLSYIENKISNETAIWRDYTEYRISKFAKFLF